jgi:phage terminase small subunit
MPRKKPRKREPAMAPRHKIFALLWLANGGNATQAYNEAFGPGKRKPETTHVNASKLLSSAKVQAFIAGKEQKALQAIEATAEEAMAAITRTLRLDPRLLLDKKTGKPLPMHEWPDDVALVVKSVKANGDVVFYDKMHAAELIAESHGKIKKKLDITLAFDHVKYLADKSRPKG